MDETCEQAGDFLRSIFDRAGLDLRVATDDSTECCRLNIDGPDADMLVAQGGELLDALQHLLNQSFLDKAQSGKRLVCDAEGFRATREAELRAMANHAAERVRSTGVAFNFGPMAAYERRIIHLALADQPDLHTESIGDGTARKLRVTLNPSSS